jgi:hypothetical protein
MTGGCKGDATLEAFNELFVAKDWDGMLPGAIEVIVI